MYVGLSLISACFSKRNVQYWSLSVVGCGYQCNQVSSIPLKHILCWSRYSLHKRSSGTRHTFLALHLAPKIKYGLLTRTAPVRNAIFSIHEWGNFTDLQIFTPNRIDTERSTFKLTFQSALFSILQLCENITWYLVYF